MNDPALTELVGFTPSCLQSWLSAAAHVPSLLHPDHRAATQDYSPGAAIAEALDPTKLKVATPLTKRNISGSKTQFESQVLGWAGDRVDMANSMEARPAFLDHPLAEFAVTLPINMRLRGHQDKYILREMMRPLLPKALYERQKICVYGSTVTYGFRKTAGDARVSRYLFIEAGG